MAAKRPHALAPWWVPAKPASPEGRAAAEPAKAGAEKAARQEEEARRRARQDEARLRSLPTLERLLQWADRFGPAVRQDLESGKRKLFIPMSPEDFAALKLIARDDVDQRIGLSSVTNAANDPAGPVLEVTLMIDPRLVQAR